MNLILLLLGYFPVGIILAKFAKTQGPSSLWYAAGPALVLLWPVLVPVVLFASICGFLWEKL
jgi:hypothetical protein